MFVLWQVQELQFGKELVEAQLLLFYGFRWLHWSQSLRRCFFLWFLSFLSLDRHVIANHHIRHYLTLLYLFLETIASLVKILPLTVLSWQGVVEVSMHYSPLVAVNNWNYSIIEQKVFIEIATIVAWELFARQMSRLPHLPLETVQFCQLLQTFLMRIKLSSSAMFYSMLGVWHQVKWHLSWTWRLVQGRTGSFGFCVLWFSTGCLLGAHKLVASRSSSFFWTEYAADSPCRNSSTFSPFVHRDFL